MAASPTIMQPAASPGQHVARPAEQHTPPTPYTGATRTVYEAVVSGHPPTRQRFNDLQGALSFVQAGLSAAHPNPTLGGRLPGAVFGSITMLVIAEEAQHSPGLPPAPSGSGG